MKTVVLDGSSNLKKKIDGDLSLKNRMDGQAGSYVQVGRAMDIQALEITANGTYEAGEGAAFNPITVNVPIPPNYGLITWNGRVLTVS